MNAYAILAAILGGGGAICALVIKLLYSAGKAQGAAEERQKIEEASDARMRRQVEAMQKEVTKDDVTKSLDDGTF